MSVFPKNLTGDEPKNNIPIITEFSNVTTYGMVEWGKRFNAELKKNNVTSGDIQFFIKLGYSPLQSCTIAAYMNGFWEFLIKKEEDKSNTL